MEKIKLQDIQNNNILKDHYLRSNNLINTNIMSFFNFYILLI